MPRMNVYVNDALKQEMDELNNHVNWSNVAQSAFQKAVESNQWLKSSGTEAAIQRFRAQKLEIPLEEISGWEGRGRKWAIEKASIQQLERIVEIEEDELEIPRTICPLGGDCDHGNLRDALTYASSGLDLDAFLERLKDCADHGGALDMFDAMPEILGIQGLELSNRRDVELLKAWHRGVHQIWNAIRDEI